MRHILTTSTLILVVAIYGNAIAIRIEDNPNSPSNKSESATPRTFNGNNIANHLVFEVVPSKFREKALKSLYKQATSIKGHIFGIYEEGINHIVIQSNIADSRVLLEKLIGNQKNAEFKMGLIQNVTVLGSYSFKFDGGGTFIGIKCSNKYEIADIKKATNIEDAFIQATQDGDGFFLWLPKNRCTGNCFDEVEKKLNSNNIEHVVTTVTEVGKRYK
jgi:hypothetical protein